MHPALNYEVMQARHHDLMRSAAQQRLAAQVKAAKAQTARRTRRGEAAATPVRRALQLIWRLLPA
jgi:hypothetical protein